MSRTRSGSGTKHAVAAHRARAVVTLKPTGGARAERVAPPESRADERLVDQAVAHLRRLVVGGQVQIVAQLGEYLIEHFYGGVENARSRNAHKAASLARLAERAPEFGMTPPQLAYAVPVALAVREIGTPIAGKLGVTRLRLLLPMKDAAQRKLLAETAASSNWTIDRLKARVREMVKPHAGGRPETPAIDRLVTRAAGLIDEDASPARLREGLDRLSPERARHLLILVNRAQAGLERAEKLLQRAAIAMAAARDK